MINAFRTGQQVQWNWGSGKCEGQIKERFEGEVSRTIKGTQITSQGDKANPAYLIEREDGDEVMKLGSELEAANKR